MAIPDYQTLMLPLLRLASDRKEHQLRAVTETLADEFALSSEERSELLPSGSQFVFANRVGWARTYLKQAGLIDSPLTRKANRDYDKRTRQTLNEVCTNSMVVFVLARRWSQKARWLEGKRAASAVTQESNVLRLWHQA